MKTQKILSITALSLTMLHFLSAQNVGLNTQTPVGTLDIRSTGQTGSSHALLVSNAASDTMVVIRDDGRVGIGTTQPAYTLDVQSADPVGARFNTRVEGQPAINQNELATLGQVQTLIVSASSSASPTMFSTQTSSSAGQFSDALVFCRSLTEGGYTDWRVPTLEDWMEMYQNDAITLPNYTSGRFYWFAPTVQFTNSSYTYPYQLYINSSDLSVAGSFQITYNYRINQTGPYTFCIR